MIEKEVICVICPSSCHITVKGGETSVSEISGYNCRRGKDYAETEYLAPKRTLSTTVKAEGYCCPIIAVRSNRPIPKEKMFEAMDEIRKAVAVPPFYVGKPIIENILDTGADIVLSGQ